MGWVWSYNRDLLGFALLLLVLSAGVNGQGRGGGYYGVRIGPLTQLHHAVKGDVYAVDSRTIHIRGFSYDGTAPDAFFYAGTTPEPSEAGFIIPDENGGVKPLGRYRGQDITLTLPDGKTFKDIRWISVWCRAFSIDFGNVKVGHSLEYPRPQKIDSLPTLEHGVTSDRIVVVDAQTFLIPNFHYDGAAPDARFWVGKGNSPGPKGTLVPDENGSEEPLKKYSGKTIVITLPGDLTVFDIDYLSVWCRAFFADFGHVRIPKNLNVPPSLKMLGVAPQTKLNCEVLWDDLAFEVRWAVAGESIVMQLVGRIEDGQYMSFGTSGALTRSVMIGGDVVVAWLDQASGRGEAKDYYLNAKAQCQGGRGACPDEKITGSSNNVRLLNAALINDFTMLTFQRPLRGVDGSDSPILTNGSQAVIWAVGPVNSQGDTSYHSLRLRGDMLVDFGRTPKWNCPLPEEQGAGGGGAVGSLKSGSAPTPPPAPKTNNAWYIPPIPCYEPADGVFYAQIGPTGGDRGYNAITGRVGWGISWYINGLLIPEIHLVRGKSYTFVVEGGYDPEHPARYHPFYITDDPEGGYEFKTPAERNRVRVFAGVGQNRDGTPVPSAYGRLCEWNEDPNQPSGAFESFGAYQRTLQLNCQEGQPGVLQWTPDANTPDTVYYQCYTHRYLGWKIRVVDQCDFDQTAAGSDHHPQVVPGPGPDYDYYIDYYDELPPRDVSAEATLQQETRVSSDYNKIPSSDRKSQRRPENHRFPEQFTFPDFPYDFPSGFESFPFDLENEQLDENTPYTRPVRPNTKPSQPPPLGAPGFTFPKLPNLKTPTSNIDATAFAKFQNQSTHTSDSFTDPPEEDFEYFESSEDIPSQPISNQYPLKPVNISTTATSTITSSPKASLPTKTINPTPSTSKSTDPISTSKPLTPNGKYQRPQTTAKGNITSKLTPPMQPQNTPSLHPNHSFPPTPFHRSTVSETTPVLRFTSTPPSQKPVTVIKQIPTRRPSPPRPPQATQSSNKQTSQQQYVVTSPSIHAEEDSTPSEPDVITAPSLPRLPGQLSPEIKQFPTFKLPFKSTPGYRTTLPTGPNISTESQDLGEAFAQNFGFDPESIVYESDFRPVKKNPAGPMLAFEVSSSDVNPVRVPLPPPPPRWSPQSQSRPAGPRTSGPVKFAERKIEVGGGQKDFASSPNTGVLAPETLGPVFHPSLKFREKVEHSPIPLPVAMDPVIPLLGGGASNTPLHTNKPPPPPIRKLQNTYYPHGPFRPPVNVNRLGKPQGPSVQQPARRLVTALVPLPDDHLIPFPQLVSPTFLKPIINFPVANEDLATAESAQVFTSDGRRLSPDAVPPTPRLNARPLKPSEVTNRPQVGPFRGSLPPPIPADVPQLTQFFRQRRPVNRMTTPMPPPLGKDFGSHSRHSTSSSPQPVVSHQEIPVVAAALLPHQELTAEIGNNEVSVISPYPSTVEPYAPARPPTTPKTEPVGTNNRTHLNILKDVWAILTMEDPDLRSKHPRDDAHPDHDHDHLDRQERRRRDTSSANLSYSAPVSTLLSFVLILILTLER